MAKIVGCSVNGSGVAFSLNGAHIIECLQCGHKEKTNGSFGGSISCPKCGSSDIEITGEKK